MTRKDYRAVADMLRTLNKDTNYSGTVALAGVVDRIARVFESDNARFNRARFFAAVYPKEG